MSTVAGVTVGVGNIGNQLSYVYKCIKNLFYFEKTSQRMTWSRVGWLSLFGEKNETTLTVLIATE